MKNAPLALSGISLVAVAILYYLHFASSPKTTQAGGIEVAAGTLKLAYINSDTVLKYYDYYKEVKVRFEAKGKKLDQDLQNRAQALQNEIGAYQRNVSTMTIGQAKAVEEDLGKKQQNFRMYQQSIEQDLANEQGKVNTELYGNITTYLKKFGADKGLEAVLKYDPTSDLLYGSAGIDITKEVIKGLNEAYQLKQKDATAKKDSVAVKK
ncbi:MAG: OmpH family outer membrane protein [Cyclobacteriaceae bacterium]